MLYVKGYAFCFFFFLFFFSVYIFYMLRAYMRISGNFFCSVFIFYVKFFFIFVLSISTCQLLYLQSSCLEEQYL